VSHNLILCYSIPVVLSKLQMVPILRFIISAVSKKKDPSYTCLSEAKASHQHEMWTEFSTSVPHFLQVGSSLNFFTYRSLLGALCYVKRPVTTLDCVLLKESNRAFVTGLRREINFGACLLSTTRTTPHYQMLVIHPACNLIFDILPGDPQRRLTWYKLLNITAPCELVGDFISSYPGMPRDPIQPHSVPGRDIIQHL